MGSDLDPDTVVKHLHTSKVAPFYLFYGPNEFLKENVLMKFRQKLLDQAAADFNLEVFYGDEGSAEEIADAARSVPFMAERRLIIVRRAEVFRKVEQETLLSYLDNPVASTCLIFVASDVNFRSPLFSRIKKEGTAVYFSSLRDNQVASWLVDAARDMGLKISHEACAYLEQIVGNNLMELFSELEKLSIRYGNKPVGIEEVRQMATKMRAYSIFELVDYISTKECKKALEALHKLLEQGGKDSALSILGMLNRQLRLLWRAKFMKIRGAEKDIPKVLGVPSFLAKKLVRQVDNWSESDLKELLGKLCFLDSRLKSGSQEDILLDHLIISLCKD